MPTLVPSGALLAAALAVSAVAAVAVSSTGAPAPAVEPQGHLILQVEGDASALRVTRITPKPDPCGPSRTTSAHQVVVRDAAGRELGRMPLDLSAFDLEPARVGGALRVEGCVVRDPHVAMLVSVPRWEGAASIELVRDGQFLGLLPPASYAQLLAEGERR